MPDVILEFLFEEGALFIALRNIGSRPAYSVHTRFEPRFRGLGGEQDVAGMPLFENTHFLGPGREIRFLLDSAAAYFSRDEPSEITAMIAYADESGQRFERRIRHNLEIYRSLPYLVR